MKPLPIKRNDWPAVLVTGGARNRHWHPWARERFFGWGAKFTLLFPSHSLISFPSYSLSSPIPTLPSLPHLLEIAPSP